MGIVCKSDCKSVSALAGWRSALDAAAQMVCRLPGTLQASRTLGSIPNPVYVLCSSLQPIVNQRESVARILSLRNPPFRFSVRGGGGDAMAYPGDAPDWLTR